MRSEASKENSRRLSNEAKKRRTGTCAICGATTRYNGHAEAVSSYCIRHAQHRMEATRGTGPTNGRVLALLDGRELRLRDIADQADITIHHAANVLHRLLGYGLITRIRRGVYTRTPNPVYTPGGTARTP